MDPSQQNLRIRPVAPGDAAAICAQRERLFAEAGRPAEAIAAVRERFAHWLRERLADGRYFGFMAQVDGRVVGGAGQIELEWPPHPAHPLDDRRGYVLNVFVEPAHRGRGIAKKLMDAAEAEFRRRGITFVALHASALGRPVYEATGWIAGNEMVLPLSPPQPPAPPAARLLSDAACR